MTKIKITAAADVPIWNWMDGNIEIADMKKATATYVNVETGHVLKLRGDDFQYDNDGLADGRVQSLSFFDDQGDLTMRLKGEYPVKELGAYLEGGDAATLEAYLLSGADKLVGSKSDDILDAGAGDDRISGFGGDDRIYSGLGTDMLTGGVGADTFLFRSGDGKDMVTDFDAQGGAGRQDFIATSMIFEDLEIRKAGDDVLIDLGGGDVLRLVDVKLRDIGHSDFIVDLPLQI